MPKAAIGPVVGGLLGLTGSLIGSNQSNHAYNTNYAPVTSGASSQLQQLLQGLNIPGLTEGTINYFTKEAENGLSPAYINNAQQQQGINTARTIANVRNQLGASTPNLGGTIQDIAMQGLESSEQLGSSLASQDQTFSNQAEEQAYQTGSNALGQATNFSGQGAGLLPNASGGISNLASQYGAGATAANQQAQANNPFNYLGSLGSSVNWSQLFSGPQNTQQTPVNYGYQGDGYNVGNNGYSPYVGVY
jgi:hypothetical protein